MKLKYWMCVLLIGGPLHLFAQFSLRGQILSATDSQLLSGVTVLVADRPMAFSDDHGHFSFTHYAEKAVLNLSYLCYLPLQATVLHGTDGHFYLEPQISDLDEVMVSTG